MPRENLAKREPCQASWDVADLQMGENLAKHQMGENLAKHRGMLLIFSEKHNREAENTTAKRKTQPRSGKHNREADKTLLKFPTCLNATFSANINAISSFFCIAQIIRPHSSYDTLKSTVCFLIQLAVLCETSWFTSV
ncbi:MAG: hypothetical protein A2X20_11300 [Bacteroidetes bacterium GWE2_40_15]|nr:MAG: hypothetical protein A2X20_11300 [Bacteroidetes bacterium GWE2_40_15]